MAPRRRTISAMTAISLEPQSASEAYRNALQAFIDRRRISNDSPSAVSPNSPDKERLELFIKKNYENEKNRRKDNRECEGIPGVPQVQASEIFEIGWVAGTEDRHIELIYAEWQTTRISLRRHTHPDCKGAIKADLEVLTAIRHPNVLLLMATTHTDDHGLVAIFEAVDCTLFNYVHEQGERVSVQGIAKCAGSLADALKHANMRGYIHGAISPHCVYLATSGNVKLGGWELATSVNNPKITRDYEERLKFEIYRWLAPEIFKGEEPTKATDVYGLTLLMWEMCTMNVPWHGLSKTEVELQYVQWGRGVITDLYNFPPLLNNLLDAGLQIDVSKRTLDMGRMRRFLQRLQIQYEDAKPIYVELSSNNNMDNAKKLGQMPTKPIVDTPTPQRSDSATPKRYPEKKSATIVKEKPKPRYLNLNIPENAKIPETKEKKFIFEPIETAPMENLDRILKGKNVQKINSKNVNNSRSTEKISVNVKKISRKDELPNLAVLTVDSTDDETFPEPRLDIKKLKQDLANKRENFFYGNETSPNSTPEKCENPENPKNRMLKQVRSKDYEPHKPASHKTCLQPKQKKSPVDFNSVPSKFSLNDIQKSAYSYVPSSVRRSILHPKILNSNSSSFFETSLWKKEKMICISKMRKGDVNNYALSLNRSVSTTSENIDKTDSAESNCTYTIDVRRDLSETTDTPETSVLDRTAVDVTTSTLERDESLLALKEALERATDIVRSGTPHPSECSTDVSSPFKSPRNLEINSNRTDPNESLFEDIYELEHDEPESEIKIIERSANSDNDDLFGSNVAENNVIVDENSEKNDFVVRRRKTMRDEKRGAFEGSRLSSVACESIAESINENDNSSNDSGADDRTVVLSESTLKPEAPHRCPDMEVKDQDGETETSFALMVFSDKNMEGCKVCNPKRNLARRRSLPAGLGQLRNLSNASLGKLPIRKVDVPDNSLEDLYIDDEFGDSLNVNMVLLDEDAPIDDEEFLPDLLE